MEAKAIVTARFTPGPWRIDHVTLAVSGIRGADGILVGTSINEDAHLIAAAPELYEALIRLCDAVTFDTGTELGTGAEVAIALARDILAKAEVVEESFGTCSTCGQETRWNSGICSVCGTQMGWPEDGRMSTKRSAPK
jgi:hypothetical protein